MDYNYSVRNNIDGYTAARKTSTAMLELRERIDFMLSVIATPDELGDVADAIEGTLGGLGYSFFWNGEVPYLDD